jgi:hypothetical protein
VEQQEIPEEEAAVETIGALEDRCLAIGRCQQLKKQTQGDGESQKKLVAVHRWMTRRAVPARCRGCSHKGPMVKKTEGRGIQQWNKGPRHKMAPISEEGEDIRQDLQDDCRPGDQKANSLVFNCAMESDWTL